MNIAQRAIFVLLTVGVLFVAQSYAQTSVRVGAIGDFGQSTNSQAVANLVAGWNPDFVITVGDNNYTADDITIARWDLEVGQYYHQFIRYPAGSTSAYAPGSATNKFFPSLGNHDWDDGITGWHAYFELPDNERYFDYVRGPVHFFVIDSDSREPDGNASTSTQAQWLRNRIASSTSPWRVVYFHHPPYTSTTRGNNVALQWPFPAWGATAVLSGHDHHYERIMKNGFPYIVDGSGGRSLDGFISTPEPGSVVRYNGNYGALKIEANTDSITFSFFSIAAGGTLIDRFTIDSTAPPPPAPHDTVLVPSGASWKFLDNGSNQGTAWRGVAFNDSIWASGPAELGYGDGGEATVVNCGPGAPACTSNNLITTYFRSSFTIANASLFGSLTMNLLADDGAVVYLNNAEVFRTNMPAGSIVNTTPASSAISGAAETTYVTTSVSPVYLNNGKNVLAVEIHQRSTTSSDISFNLKLVGTLSETALPIQLSSFNAVVLNGHEVRLDWETLTETNNYGFEVQKSAGSTANYQTIHNSFVPGHGTTLVPHSYTYTDVTAIPGIWYYRLKQMDLDGAVDYSDGIAVGVLSAAEEEVDTELPEEVVLKQNFPNPFNPSTIIGFSIPRAMHVSLAVYNMLGQEVGTLVDVFLNAGNHDVLFPPGAATLPSGVYMYRLNAGGFTSTRKLVLLK